MGQRAWDMVGSWDVAASLSATELWGSLWRVPGAYQLLEGPLEAAGQPPCVGCCVPEQLPTSRHQWLACGSRLLGSGPINLRSLAVVGDKGCPCSPRPRHGFSSILFRVR